jgi:1,2-diacylglycerol-3-alpha-glucose alpha-1,2-galactosyltransferase
MFLILQQKLYDTCEMLRVNVISESAFTAQGHGVHTAFTETIDALKDHTDCDVAANTSRPADVVHIHTTGPYAIKKLFFDHGAKVISAHVTPDSFVGSIIGAKYWYRIAKWYLRWFYNRADVVLAVSQEVYDQLTLMGVRKKIELVPNTINTDLFRSTPELKRQARERLGIAQDEFVVICSGQVQPRKRVDTFIRCAKTLPELNFIWVGGIPFGQIAAGHVEMQKLMDNPPTNVSFTGVIPREDVVNYYVGADVFMLPSDQETFGIVIVEAAAAGLPVLLRDLEQYKITFAGCYDSADDDAEFAAKLKRYKDDNKYYRKWQLAAAGIAERYGSKAGARLLMQAYNDAAAIHSKTGAK